MQTQVNSSFDYTKNMTPQHELLTKKNNSSTISSIKKTNSLSRNTFSYNQTHNTNKNNDCTYYTYKITSNDSPKYYFGVRKLQTKNATTQDCLKDSYMGTGGSSANNKYKVWKKKYKNSLKKEIMGLFSTKEEAYAHEKELVGQLFKEDPLCLNSVQGGILSNPPQPTISLKTCPTHGKVKHFSNTCLMCRTPIFKKIFCVKHGEVNSRNGNDCFYCELDNLISYKECSTHGLTKHRGNSCYSCSVESSIHTRTCSLHGVTKHRGDNCCKCTSLAVLHEDTCSIHGKTIFSKKTCLKCEGKSRVSMKSCLVHGFTKHRGNSCYKCSSEKVLRTKHEKWHVSENRFSSNCRLCGEESLCC